MKKGGNPLHYLNPIDRSMFFDPVLPHEVSDMIDELNPAKATGLYRFPVKVIKDIQHLICKPLSFIINKSVKKGIFPEKLKVAKVTPVFKSGDKLDIANYRPISVLPLFDKIFEKAINTRLKNFLFKNKILTIEQFGFQKGKSTADAVLNLTNQVYSSLKNNEICCTILLDLAKAFDTVDHSILLNKLSIVGIRGPLLAWFQSYLNNRSQIVSIESDHSEPVIMKFGVPQGSVLGPTLFLIYINDIINSTSEFKFTLFADDTCLFMKHNDPKVLEEKVNKELEHINNWLTSNRLSLNVKKSCFLLFSGKKKIDDFKVKICDTEVGMVSNAKYLGVIIDDKLSWQPHLEHVLTKMKQGTGMIRRLSHIISPSNLSCLYYSFCQSYLQYCITSWGSPDTKNLTKLNKVSENITNKINRILLKSNLNPFNPLNVKSLYKLECCNLIHKIKHKKAPKILNNLFSDPKHQAGTRIQDNSLFTLRYDRAPSPICFYGPQFWNQNCLPFSSLASQDTFASKLKSKLSN